MSNPVSFRHPFESEIAKLPPEIQQAHRFAFNGLLDLNNAVAALNTKMQGIKAGATSNTTTTITEVIAGSGGGGGGGTAGVSSFNGATGGVIFFPDLGLVNNQTGQTSYVTQAQDNGAFIILDAASAIAVTLNFSVQKPWYTTLANYGTGAATLTPSQGTISYAGTTGAGSMPLPTGYAALVWFDGTNWWAVSVSINAAVTGVTSLDGIAGAVSLVAGANVTITDNSPSAGQIKISATSGSTPTATQNAGLASFRSLFLTSNPLTTPPASSIFHNTNTGPMYVTVAVDLGGGGFVGAVYCDSSSTPTTQVAQFARVNSGSSPPNYYPSAVTFVVPSGYYYGISVTNGSGTPFIQTWTEWILS